LTGYSKEEICSGLVRYGDVIHPECRERVGREVTQSSEASVPRFSHKPYRIIARDGSIRWVSDHTIVVRNEKGEIETFLGYVADITDQRKNDDNFAIAQKWRALIEGLKSPINIITTDFRVVTANQVLLDKLKMAEEEVVARFGEYGFRGRLLKPFKLEDLKKEIQSLG
jgi:PAS domain S-box-containing protein